MLGGHTRQSFTVHEDATGLDWRFVLPGPVLAPAEWQRCVERALAEARGRAWVVVSGSLPPGVPEDACARLARLLAPLQVPLAVDTSGSPLAAALAAGVDLVKPSLRELEHACGRSLPGMAERIAACRQLVARGGARRVALSLGAEGAILVTPKHAWHAPALQVPVASSIGAGDSLLAGLVAGLARGDGEEAAFALGLAASAASLLSQGTALCQPQDVQRLLPQVRLLPLP